MQNIFLNATLTAPTSVKEYPVRLYEKIRENKFLYFGVVAAAYFLMTVVFTWPILPNFDKQLADTGDQLFIAWVVGSEIWSLRTGDFANFWNQPIFYPYPNTLALSDHSLTLTLQALPTYLITNNPVATANSLVFTGFFLSALFAYLLVFHYSGSRKAAFISGAVYGFSTYHIAQISHLQVINYQYIPLTLLFFEKLLKNPNWKNALFFALAFTLNAFVSVYLLGFILVPLAVILVLRFLSREAKLNKKFLLNFLLAGVLTAALVGPWLLPYLDIGRDFNVYHGVEEYYGFSAHPGDFLIANETNWLLGSSSSQVKAASPLESWSERTVYLGILTVVAALFGILYKNKEKKKFQFTTNSAIWCTVLLSCLLFALGPILVYNGPQNPIVRGPYALLTQVLPIYKGIRVPSRFLVIVVLALAVLIGFAAKKLEGYNPRLRVGLYAAFALIFLIEQGSFPLYLQTPSPVNTALYQWTAASLPKEAVLAHYPFQKVDFEMNYLRGALIDRHRTLNGYSSFTPESIARLEDLASSDPAAFLKISPTMGINYLVIHGDLVTANDSLVSFVKERGLALLATIGNDSIYNISAGKDKTLYSSAPVSTGKLENGRLMVDTKNDTSTIFVTSQPLEKFNIKVTYLKGGNKVGENNLSYYKPLFLMPGEVSSASLEISPPLLGGFDDVQVDIK